MRLLDLTFHVTLTFEPGEIVTSMSFRKKQPIRLGDLLDGVIFKFLHLSFFGLVHSKVGLQQNQHERFSDSVVGWPSRDLDTSQCEEKKSNKSITSMDPEGKKLHFVLAVASSRDGVFSFKFSCPRTPETSGLVPAPGETGSEQEFFVESMERAKNESPSASSRKISPAYVVTALEVTEV